MVGSDGGGLPGGESALQLLFNQGIDFGAQDLFLFLALCEIQWVIKFHFPTEKINHVDKVVDIAVAPGASFG